MQRVRNDYFADLEWIKITSLGKSEKKNKDNISKKRIHKLIRQILVELGENPDREGLIDTPRRIADMYEEIFAGYRMNAELETTFSEQTDGPIIAKNIEFYSISVPFTEGHYCGGGERPNTELAHNSPSACR